MRLSVVLVLLCACGTRTAPWREDCTPRTLARPLGLMLGGLESDGDRLYWLTGGGSAGPRSDLVRTPRRGGDTVTIATDVASFALAGDRVYWVEGTSERGVLWSARAIDGTKQRLAGGVEARWLSVIEERVFLASPHGIRTLPVSGGPAVGFSADPAAAAVLGDASFLYFATWNDGRYAVVRTRKDGSNPSTLFESAQDLCIRQLVLGPTRLYWVEITCAADKSEEDVRTMLKMGGPAEMIPKLGGPIALEGETLFGTNAAGCYSCKPHTIDVIRSDGTTVLAGANGSYFSALACDRDAIYVGVNRFEPGAKPAGELLARCR